MSNQNNPLTHGNELLVANTPFKYRNDKLTDAADDAADGLTYEGKDLAYEYVTEKAV